MAPYLLASWSICCFAGANIIMAWSNSACIGLIYVACALAQVPQRKNVVMIVADDYRPNMGVYEEANDPFFNSPTMVTPNLDILASRSFVATRAYCQVALCGPSRNSFLTGRRPDTTRVYDNNDVFRDLGPNNETSPIVTIPQFFKDNGYISLAVGKIFHSRDLDDAMSWTEDSYWPENTDDDSLSWRAFMDEEIEEVGGLQDQNSATYAVEKLQELAPGALLGIRPFFLAFGVRKPHLPWDFPEEFLEYYPEEDIELPANPYVPSDMPGSAWDPGHRLTIYPDCSPEGTGIENIGEPNVTYSEPQTRELRRAYYASVSYSDQQIGRVLQELGNLGLAENTIVVFLGDHGYQLGEHSAWEKKTNFEIAHRAPFMIHVPGMIDSFIESDSLVEFVDIFPTLVEAAGFDPMTKCPPYSRNISLCREGSSILDLITDPEHWKSSIFYQQMRANSSDELEDEYQGYSVMTDKYRFTEWVGLNNGGLENQTPNWSDPKDFAELYDLKNDPQENINLIFNEEYQDVIFNMREVLHQGWEAHN